MEPGTCFLPNETGFQDKTKHQSNSFVLSLCSFLSPRLCFVKEDLRHRGCLDHLFDLPCELWRHPSRHAHEVLVELPCLDEQDKGLFGPGSVLLDNNVSACPCVVAFAATDRARVLFLSVVRRFRLLPNYAVDLFNHRRSWTWCCVVDSCRRACCFWAFIRKTQ